MRRRSRSDFLHAEREQGRTLWVDMESSLRTILKDDGDIFDANKAMKCVSCVVELGLEPKLSA